MKIYLLLFILCLGTAALSQTPADHDKKLLEKQVHDFFRSLEKRDTALLRSLLMEGADIWTVRRRNDSLVNRTRTAASDLQMLAAGGDLIEESPFRTDITLHGDIAMAWVPYTISVGGKFSHCGIDVFTFLRAPEGWKIVSMAYSIEPEGCGAVKNHH